MSTATQSLPAYLKRFVAEQDYDSYTAQDHAAWRFIMRQNRSFFSKHAVGTYLEGLAKTGISIERIPRVSEMDECLSRFGWGAVPVEGFIPPAAFLDFQARSVLPIACDMRTVNHIAYTPAPDIVHEAAGHAPILSFGPYAEYLRRYAAMARKAIFSKDDIRLYEAIRYLSDIKENPDTEPSAMVRAEARLNEVAAGINQISEAAKIARMNWWTVEYGLVGDIKHPKIYGAGLLSSVGESQACLSDRVRKLPLTVACVDTSYNITEPQPQLFVARDMDHLVQVLEELESTLFYKRGGIEGLEEAVKAATVTTLTLDSGLQMSGTLESYLSEKSTALFVKYSGPVQLCVEDVQLEGQGPERHGSGFSSPLGSWKGLAKKASDATDDELSRHGLHKGRKSEIVFTSGFKVAGTPVSWSRGKSGKLQFITWKDCTVTRGEATYFEPAWGEFDMAVGEQVLAVAGGPSDRAAFGEFDVGKASSSPGRSSAFSLEEIELFKVYGRLRTLRESGAKASDSELISLVDTCAQRWPSEWLLQMELFELGQGSSPPWLKQVENLLKDAVARVDTDKRELIEKGMALARAIKAN